MESGTNCICTTDFPTWTEDSSAALKGDCKELPVCSATQGDFILKTDSCKCPSTGATEFSADVTGKNVPGCLIPCSFFGVNYVRKTNSARCECPSATHELS